MKPNTTINLPQHFAVDVLASKSVEMVNMIERLEKDNDAFEQSGTFPEIVDKNKVKIMHLKKQVGQCRQGIAWIYEMMDTEK